MQLLCCSGRKEIIADFKALLSSFPEEMGIMQRQLSDFKETASDIHSLRADVQSLSAILDRKVSTYASYLTSLVVVNQMVILFVSWSR